MIIAVLLVGLIGGASVLSQKYSGEVETDRLLVEESAQSETTEETEDAEETVAEATETPD